MKFTKHILSAKGICKRTVSLVVKYNLIGVIQWSISFRRSLATFR